MAHSNQLREFRLTDTGIELTDVYLGPEGVLTGSMRLAQEARESAAAVGRREEAEARQRERARKREALEARILAMRKEFEAEERELRQLEEQEGKREKALLKDRDEMAHSRKADAGNADARADQRNGGKT